MKKIISFIISYIIICNVSFAYDDFHDLKAQADNGNAVAQYELGSLLIGSHSQADYKQALKYLRLSSENGYTPAKTLIYDLTSKGYESWGDFDLLPWYDFSPLSSEFKAILSKYSLDGYAGASLELAHNFYHDKDYSNALQYYELTLKQVNPQKPLWQAWEDSESEDGVATMQLEDMKIIMDAITRIAYCYEHGYGVEKDITKAIAYYEMFGGYDIEFGTDNEEYSEKICQLIKNLSLEYNNTVLNEYIGECGGQIYDCLMPDVEAVRAWHKIDILKIQHWKLPTIINDVIERCSITNSSIDSDRFVVCSPKDLWVGEIYYKGLGGQQDYNKAFNVFNYIATQAIGPWGSEFCDYYPDIYADACYRLYECYAFGRGVDKNPSKASHFFNEALIYGSSSALYDNQKRYETLNK